MKSVDESVTQAMDGSDARIVPYLPYILQDTWEIGTSARKVIGLVRRHTEDPSRLRALDLGCGKGAVSVLLAKELGCRCLGIDAIAEFVDFAAAKAREYGVAERCRFEAGDVRERIGALERADVIVLGAIGPVFGNYRETLVALSPLLATGGVIVIDDAYATGGGSTSHPLVATRGDILGQIAQAGMRLAEEEICAPEDVARADDLLFAALRRRCEELMEAHPDKRWLFEEYVRRQVEENEVLENEVVCAILAIKRS